MVTLTTVDQGLAPTATTMKFDGVNRTTTSLTYADAGSPNDTTVADTGYYWIDFTLHSGTHGNSVSSQVLEGSTVKATYGTYQGSAQKQRFGTAPNNYALQNTQGSSQIVKFQIKMDSGAVTANLKWNSMVVMTPAEYALWEFIDIGSLSSTSVLSMTRYRKQYADKVYLLVVEGGIDSYFDGSRARNSENAIKIIDVGTVISQYSLSWTTGDVSLLAFKMTGSKFTAT